MTDRLDSDLDANENFDLVDADLELITSYLNGHLDPVRAAAVRRRLEEDAAFAYLAEPLLLAWSVPKHIVRHPRPEGEWERDWAEFKRRAGITHDPLQPPAPKPSRWERFKAFNNSTGAKVMFFFVLGAYLYGAKVALDKFGNMESPVVAEQRQYTAVAFDTGWISLGDGIEVQMPREAALNVDARNLDGMKHVVLNGTARFRVLPLDATSRLLRRNALYVETSAGSVWAGESDFTVTAGDSSTAVAVRALGPRRAAMPNLRTVMISRARPYEGDHVSLLDHEEGRLVRGQEPTRVAGRR